METTRVGEKTLELIRTRLLDAVKKEAAALVAENFGGPNDIDRNFKALFQAELGPHEIADPDRNTLCDDKRNMYDVIGHNPTSCLDQKRSVDLAGFARENLVGVWRVLEYSMIDKSNRNQKMHPWGPMIDGQIMFSPNGYINALVEIPGQAPFGGDEPWAAGEAELVESAKRSCSYSGKFYVEWTTLGPTMIYDLDLCNYPVFAGRKFRVFLDFVKKDNQQYLVTTLTNRDNWTRQKHEVFRKL
ncbi:uncharacterized protein N7458_006015 [Penicillium daleae]|uniref:Lipocalin-like domain-containing protein n=1 Tax=Penicillium daleae TaxID=63821 RepID=A0AAD6C3Q9_9EURO|nr:uncharacterized protein N7458_006015 [Penicillium daleae]KAJ5449566.1 hypothetical protein N7458_006015 [Penicillium daleae]